MVTIRFDNTWAYIEGDPAARMVVQDYLTYRPEGFQYMKAYKNKRWDGWKSLYHVGQNRFPAGLTQDVATLLRSERFEVEILDTRQIPLADPLLANLNGPAVKMMDHQLEAILRIQQATRGVVHHPVGAGKSVVIVGATVALAVPTLVLVQRKELLRQQYDQFVALLPDDKDVVGMVGDGVWNPRPITVATIQTLAGRLRKLETMADMQKWLKQWNAVLIDECHHLPADTYAMLLRNLDNAYWRIGLSATPHRSGKKEQELSVTGLTGPIISAYEQTEGIEMGRLVPADVFLIDPGDYPKARGKYTYADELRDGVVENDSRNELIVKLAEAFGEQGPTMVLTERIAHGKALRQLLLEAGHEEVT